MKHMAKILMLVAFLVAPCAAEIIIVDQQWPYDFNNIQAAIDYSSPGDYIIVFPGTYTGPGNRDIDFLGKAITVRSVFPDDPCIVAATIIDCSGEPHNGFLFQSYEDTNSILDGFTVTGCLNEGGGICCRGGRAGSTSPSILDCIITANAGGIYCERSSPKITGCTINDNSSYFGGGGIYCEYNSNPTIADCTITNNSVHYLDDGGGGIYCYESNPTITNCTINDNSGHDGGGIYCEDSNTVITDCNIIGNHVREEGGGIYCRAGSTTISDCVISNNYTDGRGGGGGISVLDGLCLIYNSLVSDNNTPDSGGAISCRGGDYDCNVNITDCTITGNTAYASAGGICCRDTNAIITGCTITGNTAGSHDGGGGILIDSGSAAITDCNIAGNYAGKYGGGIYQQLSQETTITGCTIMNNIASSGGGGIYNCNGPITNCIIAGNSALEGGGLEKCDGQITNCIIAENSAYCGGGMSDCYGDITNCSITGNYSAGDGGGFAYGRGGTILNCSIIGNYAEIYGGGIAHLGGEIINSTIADNAAGESGGALFEYSGDITNCIIWDNVAADGMPIYPNPEFIFVSFTNLQGGPNDVYVDTGATLNWLLGNIDVDPCFVKPGFWADVNDPNIIVEPNDPNAVWVNGDYHLKSAGWSWDAEHGRWTYDDVTSRCIDAGNPGSPLGDEPLSIIYDPYNEFGQNLRINMGAFGGTAEASIPPYDWVLLSDMTNDGISDFNDLRILSSLWLNTGQQLYADFDRDGDVDFSDFALLADDWLKQTSWNQ